MHLPFDNTLHRWMKLWHDNNDIESICKTCLWGSQRFLSKLRFCYKLLENTSCHARMKSHKATTKMVDFPWIMEASKVDFLRSTIVCGANYLLYFCPVEAGVKLGHDQFPPSPYHTQWWYWLTPGLSCVQQEELKKVLFKAKWGSLMVHNIKNLTYNLFMRPARSLCQSYAAIGVHTR